MLLKIREKTQGWFAYAIVILISVPFALWGVASYIGVGEAPSVVKVGDKKITEGELAERTRLLEQRYQSQFGSAFKFPDEMLKKQALESLVDRAALEQTSKKLGLRASDNLVRSYIRNHPSFQVNGQFDKESYLAIIQRSGYNEAGFIQGIRQDLVISQFNHAYEASAFITPMDIKQKQRLENQQRDFLFIQLARKPFLDQQTVTEDEIQAFYKRTQANYKTDEMVSFSYLDFSVKNLANKIEVTDEALQTYFETNKADFVLPEKRQTRHILISVDEKADEQTVKAAETKIKELQQQIKDGADFSEVAKKSSNDPGSSIEGGNLGWVEHGMMVKPFEEAVFNLAKNTLSEPIRTKFGFHLIEVTDIKSSNVSLRDVRNKVIDAYKTQKAMDKFYDLADEVANLAAEIPDSLETAANEAGIKIQQSGLKSRTQFKDLLANPKIISKAFNPEFIDLDENSEAIEIADTQIVFIHINKHQEPSIKPLSEVKPLVETALKAKKATDAMKQQVDAWLVALKDGSQTLEGLSKAQNIALKVAIETPRVGSSHPFEIVSKSFAMPHPSENKISFDQITLKTGDIAIIGLNKVIDGKTDETISLTDHVDEMSRQGSFELSNMISAIKKNINIEFTKK